MDSGVFGDFENADDFIKSSAELFSNPLLKVKSIPWNCHIGWDS